ncbi:MAG: CHAT domain-containing tetratricopeptide repeat protein [Pseudomonadota bacterium]
MTRVCLALAVCMLIVSCKTTEQSKMSFEEARDVVLSMQSIPLEPPARKMDDIIVLLSQDRQSVSDDLAELMRRADAQVPAQAGHYALFEFYRARGKARYELNRYSDSRRDIRRAMEHGQDSNLYHRLAELEMIAGRYESALELSKRSRENVRANSMRLGPDLAFESRIIHRMGDFNRAEQYVQRAQRLWEKVPKGARLSWIALGGYIDEGNQNDILAAEAELLEAQGQYQQAHSPRAMVLNDYFRIRATRPLGAVYARLALAGNLMHQGQLVQAEKEARTAVTEAVNISGGMSSITADALQMLGVIMLAKGDLPSARSLSTAQIDILGRLGLSVDEDIMVRARIFQANVESTDYDFKAAMQSYDSALEGMRDNPYFFKRYACRNPGLILTLMKSQRIFEAEKLIRTTREINQALGVKNVYEEAELQAFDAMVLKAKGQPDKARSLFSRVIPDLLTIIQDPNSNFEKRRRAGLLLQVYINSLLEWYQAGQKSEDVFFVADEILKLADAQYSRVNSALGESSARAASLVDPELAALVRQEQDAKKRIRSLEAAFFNATAATSGDRSNATRDLERTIQSLSVAHAAISARINKDFPKYSNYINPKPPGMAQIQERLLPGEAFITLWTLENKTCVWAIPSKGDPAFNVVELGEEAVRQKVGRLRRALRPGVRMLSEIPDFDLTTAYALYDRLLRPVEPAWRDAHSLLVVVKGPLDQIPLAVLPTKKVKSATRGPLLFDEYQQVPWLVRKAAITRLPSAAALLTLRALPAPHQEREPFVGFGDPIFNLAQLQETPATHSTLSQRGAFSGEIAIRGIRIIDAGEKLDSAALSSVRIEQLSRLPDTADEIRQIAASLKADPVRDVFLGKAATEAAVKSQDLSRKRIIAFATHALLPGDLDGLTQPALAFSAPEVTESDEDGLLTLGEILTLNLDADLVLLSACDTGAGDGNGTEAVSGLGRAFFYAGARALLVTMWPVETSSARLLTTELFRYQQENKSLSTASALQNSIFKIMEGPGLKDNTTGEIVASYAHPFFWAPFVIIGEGG